MKEALPEKHDVNMARNLGGKELLSTHSSSMIPSDILRRKEHWVVKQRERTKNISHTILQATLIKKVCVIRSRPNLR